MTTDSKISSQTIDETVDYRKFIRKLKPLEYFLLGFQLIAYGLISGIFANLFIGLSGLPYAAVSANPFGFYAICLAFIAVLLFLLFYRTHLFLNKINRKTSGGFIHFSHWWRRAMPIITAFLISYYLFYAYTQDFRFFSIPMIIFFFMMAIFAIFDKPLTEEGEIYILADSTISNLDNFKEGLFFWKKLAGKIEQELKLGDYAVSQKDLVFYFTKKVLETDEELSEDLVSFRDFLLGKKRSCFEALMHIIPKSKIKRQSRKAYANKLPIKIRKNWKIIIEITGFIASIATIIGLILVILTG